MSRSDGLRLGRDGLLLAAVPAHGDLAILGLDRDRRALADLAGDERPCDTGFHLPLDEPPQGTGPVHGVIPLAGDQRAALRPQLEPDAAVGKAATDVGDLQLDDPLDLV